MGSFPLYIKHIVVIKLKKFIKKLNDIHTYSYFNNLMRDVSRIGHRGIGDYGYPVGAGVYLYQLQTKDFVKTRKMVLLK